MSTCPGWERFVFRDGRRRQRGGAAGEVEVFMTQGDPHELQAFDRLQQRLWPLYAAVGNQGPRVVVVVPSVSLDGDELRKIPGMIHYEERLLFTMQLLRDPDT